MNDEGQAGKVVSGWINAVNEGDLLRADELVADHVSIIGPRGTTSGRDVVAGWVQHTGIRMTVRDIQVNGEVITIEAEGTWQVEGGPPGERTPEATIAMAFAVRDGKIVSIERL